MNASSHNLQVALKCQQAGLFIFVAGPDKKPRVKWRDESTTDHDQVKKWFKQWPNSLPAIDLTKSGHIILDGDRHGGPDGVAGAEQLFAERSLSTATIPTVITPQDGRHYWFTQPTEGEPLGNSNKSISGKGIDVRGAGGYVIAPGTRLPDGREYKHDPNTPSALEAVQAKTVPVLPPSIAALLRAKPNGHDKEASQQQTKSNGHDRSYYSARREEAYAQSTLEALAAELAATVSGGRNITLNNCAMRMGHMVGAGWIDRPTVERRLFKAAQACGMVGDDGSYAAKATIKSGLDAGEKEPHAPLSDRGHRSPNSSGDAPPWSRSPSITPDADGYTGDGADATGNGATANGGRDGSPLKWIDMSNWDKEPVPERKWAIRDCVPLHQAGLFSGEGGTGKSILELTKNVAHVTGRDWLGLLPEPGPTIYVGAEDSEDEIHIRLAAIAKHYSVSFKELIEGGLHLLCLLGEDATLVAANGKSGKIETTNLYWQLYEAAGDIKPKNISIDTLSRAFAGNEIDRVQVYAFANYMQKIAMVADGSVTILSHPSLAGMSNGSGISGSTAWHGAFLSDSTSLG